ncbi:MAG: GNAT family N-acetyltransferase [Patescibacteria group bacterium]
MSIVIKEIDIKNPAEWDSFVDESYNGTIFHKLGFLQYHPEERFTFTNLAFYEKEELIAVIPGGLVNGVYKSPIGASYGGFVTKTYEYSVVEQIIDTFLNHIKCSNVKQIQITAPPYVYSLEEGEVIDFVLKYRGFDERHHLISNIKLLWNIKGELLDTFSSMHKRAVAKSYKLGVSVEINDDYESFYNILLENKKKFNVLPTHTLDEIKKIKRLFPESLKLFMAYDKNKVPVAGILVFVCNKTTLLTFYIAHYYSRQELRAVNRLFYEISLWGIENGYHYLDLGISMDTSSTNVMEPSRSLIFFKEGIGSRGFKRTTYQYDFGKDL